MSMEILEHLLVLHGQLLVELLVAYLRKSNRLKDAVPSKGSRLSLVNEGKSQEQATKLQLCNGKNLDITSKEAKSSTEEAKRGLQERKLEKKVFVRNINFRTTQRDLWDHFEVFGKVKHCRILRNTRYSQNRSRGMALVSFVDEDGVTKALSATTELLTLDSRILTVEKAEKKERRAKQWPEPEEESWLSSEINEHRDITHDDGITVDDATPNWVYDSSENTPIHRLNEDTLLTIFSYLPFRERVRVERVCRRWRQVALRSWQTLQHFDVNDTIYSFKGIRDKDIKWLLRKMNPECLRSVNLTAAGSLLTDESLEVIGRLCPNLREADISKIGASNRGLKAMAERCPHLESVTMDNCHYIGEDGFWWLFHRCKELRHFSLANSKRLKGQCFHVLGHNLQTLMLLGCSKLQDVGISKIASRCTNLTDLTLDECYKLTDAIFPHITQGCKSLRRLSLERMAEVTESGLQLIGGIPTLEELHLEANLTVTDSVMVAIAQGCSNLRLLNLTCCYEVTNTGVAALGQCPHLKELRLSYLHLVSDAGILPVIELGQLQKLICRGCGALGDEGMAQVANLCTQLELLDISGCDQLSDATVNAFVAAFPIRKCNLTINIGGTHMGILTETPCTNLTITHLNLSDRRLRRDADLFFNMEPFSDDDDDDEDGDDHFIALGVEGAVFDWGYDDADYDFEDFLDNDDPLQYEHWDMG